MAKKKILLISLAIVMVLSLLAACSGNNNSSNNSGNNNTVNNGTSNSNNSGGSTNSGGDGGGAAADNPPPDPVKFTYFNAGASRNDVETKDTMIGKIYYEKTGVNVAIEHLVGDVAQKIGTFIASGEYPDILVPDTEIDKVVDAGGFIPLNDLIEEHAPNIKKVYGPYFNLMKHSDGNIYFLPFDPLVGEYKGDFIIGQGAFWIQHRVLKELGYPKLKTLDEYFGAIREYVNKHPDEDLIGFTSLTDDWQFFAFSNVPNHLMGYPNDGGVQINMETMEADDYTDNEETRRWLKTVNDLYHEGLFDETSFVNNYDQYLARLTSGRVLGTFVYGWQVFDAFRNIQASGNGDLEYMPLPIVMEANIKDQYIDPPSFVNNRGIGITTSAKDPVRIIKFFDFLLEEENQIMNQWGIEGETYVVENGRLTRTPEQIEKLRSNAYNEQVGLTYFGYYWPMWSQASTTSDGNAVSPARQPELASDSYTQSERDFLAAYGVKAFPELFATPDDRPWYPAWSIALESGSREEVFTTRKDELMKRYFPRLALAAPGQFDAIWDEFVREFNKLDVKLYEETMTRLVREKAAAVRGN